MVPRPRGSRVSVLLTDAREQQRRPKAQFSIKGAAGGQEVSGRRADGEGAELHLCRPTHKTTESALHSKNGRQRHGNGGGAGPAGGDTAVS